MKLVSAVVGRISAAACVAAIAGRGLPAQLPAAPSAAAYGFVADQFAQPVNAGEVLIAPSGGPVRATRTGETGAYRLDSIGAGSHTLRVRRLGYLPLSVPIEVKEGDTQNRDLTVVKLPFALDPALVQSPDGELRARFADFGARQAGGVGVFVDRAGIERLRPSTATDIARAVKSFRVLRAGNGGYRLVSSASVPDAACTVRYLVDGFPYTPVDGLDDFDPEHIEALEAYGPGEAPAPLDGVAGSCGTVVVWLRR